jgi:ABC-type transport system involved in multi-copper enzyme maturation permease subunit
MRVLARIAIGALMGFVYWLVWYNDSLDEHESHFVFGWFFNVVLWLLTCVVAATAIAQEKESDTWTLLLATPLSGRQIVYGKLAGILWRLKWPALFIAAHYTIFWLNGTLTGFSTAVAVWVILTFNSLWAATGLYLSLKIPKTTVAVVVNLLLGVLLYLAVMLVELAAYELIARYWDDGPFVLLTNPYWYITIGIEAWGNNLSAMRTVDLAGFGGDLNHVEFGWLTLIAGLVYLAISALIFFWTIVRFDRIVGRARSVGKAAA